MGAYWKSIAAEVLPSWLKNLRAGHRAVQVSPPRQAPPRIENAPCIEESDAAATNLKASSTPGTSRPKER